ncbi:synaptic vesicle glycoprotein 2B [Halyomorpha halys]|uniref:synaptic vesicle glycoprotein 2B n=1 Tax=Halyomorpha halys TaxID=286706 RepID=UPI0006D4EA61|nr:synaptic vesicle glycoprotein 2B [Halyomorpha halys]
MTGSGKGEKHSSIIPGQISAIRADPIADSPYEEALSKTGYGKFHYYVLILFGGTYIASSMEVTLVSFIIPAAKCDFSMSSRDAGILTAAPLFGMTLGSFFWGFMADLNGRRNVLVYSLIFGGLCGYASSIAQYFPVFLLLRFFNGFCMVGALSLCLPYLGEFQPIRIREKVLCWMEMAWTSGIILLPAIAWLIIPMKFEIKSEYFLFHSWNLFVIASATPAFLLGLWALRFPESPKFLFDIGEQEKALEAMKYIYHINTGKAKETFPVESLEEKGISIIGFNMEYSKTKKHTRSLSVLVRNMVVIAKTLFKPPYRKKTLLSCSISFGVTSCYYTLMLWFPELFTRFEYYSVLHPGQSASVCEVSSVFIEREGPCEANIENQVYLNTIIVGVACIPTSLWLPTCVNKLGTKFFIVFCVFCASCLSLGMNFVTTSTQNLVLSCLFESLTSLGVVTLYCILVEIFPTNVRVMATSLTIASGRVGALLGNLVFGYLIDFECIVPILLCSGVLFATGIACIFLPVKMKIKTIEFV